MRSVADKFWVRLITRDGKSPVRLDARSIFAVTPMYAGAAGDSMVWFGQPQSPNSPHYANGGSVCVYGTPDEVWSNVLCGMKAGQFAEIGGAA